jgi:Mn2+/Fe2+ NRAMP family transporter
MPYMDMSDKTRKLMGFLLYILMLLPIFFQSKVDFMVSLLGSTTMPFITFVIPGLLYYYHLQHEDTINKKEEYSAIAFTLMGFIFIIFYNTIAYHELSN